MSTYLLILLFSISIPFLFSFHPKIKFYKNWISFLISTICIAPIFIVWDIMFTKQGIWGFNHIHTGSLKLYNLPIEECLFFLIIPYCCIFTHETLQKVFNKNNLFNTKRLALLGIFFLLLSLLFFDQPYTLSVLTGNAALLITLYLLKLDSSKIILSYFVLLIPFFIVNGLLTGSLVEEEVVWYNTKAIWNIRIGTIPLEDSLYFLLMFVSQTHIYDYLKKKI